MMQHNVSTIFTITDVEVCDHIRM